MVDVLQYLMIGFIALLAAMSPGPDFVLVSRYALYGSRKQAIGASLGIGLGLLVHITYTLLGLAIIIHESDWLYYLMKYLGAIYLTYIGMKILLKKGPIPKSEDNRKSNHVKENTIGAFVDGFICNVLNPKASLFFLSFFSQFINEDTSILFSLVISFEFLAITLMWFLILSFILTNQKIYKKIEPIQSPLFSLMGFALIGFGITIAFF